MVRALTRWLNDAVAHSALRTEQMLLNARVAETDLDNAAHRASSRDRAELETQRYSEQLQGGQRPSLGRPSLGR